MASDEVIFSTLSCSRVVGATQTRCNKGKVDDDEGRWKENEVTLFGEGRPRGRGEES